ncbi:unnamed protein product [Oikopleura dioica]|uniref:TRAF-type domain-containing protein n=1 Tax=Oikopleura dioica TaxID=34765 RepID=E4Y6I3_OIKDI|nr:unnamed protein product [Oikopleura dioica]
MTVICTAEQCNEKFPYNKRMDHLKECKGIYECKFCDAKTQVKDNHKNECIGYLQEKLKKMELLIQKNKETLKKKHDYLDRYNDGYGGYY